MKVVFVNRFFFPDISATSQLLSDLAFRLAGSFEVHVVCSRLSYDAAVVHRAAEEIRGVHIHRVITSKFGRSNLVGRACDYLTFYVSAFLRVTSLLKPGDIVVALTDPPLLSIVCAAAAMLRRSKSVNWLHDVFPEVAWELGAVTLPSFVRRTLLLLRDWSLRRAASNVVLGELMCEVVNRRGLGRRPVIIANWSSRTSIRPLKPVDNPLRTEWGLQGKFVVGYSGNMGRAHEFKTILDAARLMSSHADVTFLFVGGGNQRQFVEHAVREAGLRNVEFRPYQPRSDLGLSLAAADCHLISLRPSVEGLIVPSKLYGCLAAGRPVIFIGCPNGEIPRLMMASERRFGICVEQGRASELAEAILGIKNDPQLADLLGQNARKLLEERFDEEIATTKWKEHLVQVVTG
jgi:glycosyltransferase involved in cell wall biosynthesis